MQKKITILTLAILGILLSCPTTVQAQTDVTSQYLKNANFDNSSDFVSSIVYTYANDATNNGGVSSCQSVTGWTPDATGDTKAGGAFGYGSDYGLSGTAYPVPATNDKGSSEGGALGLAACWSGTVGYSQEITLPAGIYRVSYKVYNAGQNIIANYDNRCGFISDGGETYYDDIEFYNGEWTEGMVYLNLTAETTGKIHLGYDCGNVGSGNSPKLFVDYVKIEVYDNPPEHMLESMTSKVGTGQADWGDSRTYTAEEITGTETFQWAASLAVGTRFEQIISELPNGVYQLTMLASVSSTSGRDNTSNVITDYSTNYASLHANNDSHGIPAYNRESFTKYERIVLNNVIVSDGSLRIRFNQDLTGPNWLVVQVKDLKYVGALPSSLYYTIGDVNEDGDITIADVTALVNVILGKTTDYKSYLADVNEDEDVTIADVTALVNIILGKTAAKSVDKSYTYANLDAMVYTEQVASENTGSSSYMLNSATCSLTDADVSNYYSDISDYLTTVNVTTSLANVASVSIYALGKESISGPMAVNCQGEESTIRYSAGSALTYANSQASDVVTVSSASTGTTTAYLRPVELSSGVKVTIRTTDGKFYSQDFTNITAGAVNNLTFTQTTADNLWMATIPGNTYFSMLSTPGAHDACTSSVTSYTSIAKCQSEDLAGLLANGVRAFDLRPQYTSNTQSDIELDNLTIYHGYVSTGVKFKDAIDILINFVKANPTEAVSVIMNKENTKLLLSLTDQSETWRNSIRECFSDASRSPYLMGGVRGFHTLDDVRGKVSIVSRNPYGNSSNSYRDIVYGAIIENWPDDGVVTDYSCDMTQAWNWVDCRASVEDAYNSSTSDKQTQVETQLNLASANTDHFHYNYTYTSIANSPANYANTMNPATVNIISSLTGPLCYVYGDYMGSSSNGGADLLKAIVSQNFKYVFKGQTRVE
ncbi:MAG: hypothetical protein K6C10_12155 [Prevotella sp.]|nr:hypothetical protein [Prevotella sp.]